MFVTQDPVSHLNWLLLHNGRAGKKNIQQFIYHPVSKNMSHTLHIFFCKIIGYTRNVLETNMPLDPMWEYCKDQLYIYTICNDSQKHGLPTSYGQN